MNVGILIFPQVEELDFIGPWEMLTMWSKVTDDAHQHVIVAESLAPVTCAKGLSINPHASFNTCPALDVLVVPGGQGTRIEVNNAALTHFIAQQAVHCQAVLSVCTGAFLLHAAGLLRHKKATTHWASLQRLRELGDVQVVEERFTQDGLIWCSAGVSAGIDMTLAYIQHTAGSQIAGQVQLAAEYYPATVRYGDGANHPQAPAYLGAIPT